MICLILFDYQNSGTGLTACPRYHYITIVTAACWSSCSLIHGESKDDSSDTGVSELANEPQG